MKRVGNIGLTFAYEICFCNYTKTERQITCFVFLTKLLLGITGSLSFNGIVVAIITMLGIKLSRKRFQPMYIK